VTLDAGEDIFKSNRTDLVAGGFERVRRLRYAVHIPGFPSLPERFH
jgi:hypothetical protein